MNEERFKYVTKLMHRLGMPAHLRGYYYLRDAICMTSDDLELVGRITKLLYPEVARKYKSTGVKVERGIRKIIEVSWERGDINLIEDLFGYTREDGKKRPTNSEFIVVLADRVRMNC